MQSPFSSGTMVCAICGFKQKAELKIESGWWCSVINGVAFYICPECFGGTGAYCSKCDKYFHIRYRKCPWCGAPPSWKREFPDKTLMKEAIRQIVTQPYYPNSKPTQCFWCGSKELEYESSGLNLSGQRQDYYRCKKCFRITSVG